MPTVATYLRNIEKGKKEKKPWYQYIFPMSVANSEWTTVRDGECESEEEPEADRAARTLLKTQTHTHR
jgi:hypothetical protein